MYVSPYYRQDSVGSPSLIICEHRNGTIIILIIIYNTNTNTNNTNNTTTNHNSSNNNTNTENTRQKCIHHHP